MIKNRKKIVVIGAGSADFGLSTLATILREKELNGMELSLVDINHEGVKKVEKLAKILNEKWNSNMSISSTDNRNEVLLGADYIIISIAVDREDCWKRDYEIGLKYNISHYAENGGPGGFIHSARNISILLPIMKDIEKLCPDAFIINFTNPMQRICTLLKKTTNLKFVGMCHQIYFGYYILATLYHKELGINLRGNTSYSWNDDFMEYHLRLSDIGKKYFSIKAAGINHFTCMLDVRENATGKNIIEDVKRRMHNLPKEFEPLTQEMFKTFNLILVQGDSHVVEYVSYASDLRSKTFEDYKIPMYDFDWAKGKRKKMWEDIDLMIIGKKDVDFLKNSRTEGADIVIKSIEKDKNHYEATTLHPNIPNDGNITNLPIGAIVEVPSVISASGVNGLTMGELPKTMAEICRRQLILNDMTLDAVLHGDIKIVYQLFALDPMINNLKNSYKLADEYIKENIKYLPTFQ